MISQVIRTRACKHEHPKRNMMNKHSELLAITQGLCCAQGRATANCAQGRTTATNENHNTDND